jgi:hypothetical protein
LVINHLDDLKARVSKLAVHIMCFLWYNSTIIKLGTIMNTKITHEEYQKMWFALHEGIITEEEWRVFCDFLFAQTLEENKDVMVRLKNR